VVQQKVGLITGSIVDTSVTYNNNKTTVDINVDPYVDYNDKKALIDNLLLDTNVSYTPKNTSIQIPFDTSINYEIKEGTIDEKKLDADVEYSNKESVISDNIPDTNVLLSTNNGNIGSLREDVNIDYNTKRTLINVTEEELNSTYNGIKGQIYEELPKELQSNYNTIQGTTTNINGSTLIKYVVGSFNILQDYANYTINTSTTYDRSNIVPTGSSLNIGYGGGWITQSNDIMKSLSFIETITGSRIDNFYNSHYLFYTSSAKYDAKDPYSSSLIQSSVQNQHNLATSIRHHRFEGSKLIGPDINVNSDGTLDGTPVVEVYIVDSKEIVYRTYTDGGNLSAI
jgi:hypothetical protein